MSYTNGGQTIDKSMNGIISYDTGGGVVIEGDTITATGITADNIVCDTLQVNTSATFAGTATFNNNLPTSTITTTTNNNQFITKAIGDTLYAGGGILADNNVWTGTNAFNTYLPTSTITSTTSTTQFAPIAILNTLYGRLAIANTWAARNTFSSGITVATDVSCNSINCASSANFGSSVTVAGGVACDGCLINPQLTMQIRGFNSTGQYVFTNAGVTTPNFRFGFDYFGNSDRLIIEPLLSTFYNVVKIQSPATTSSGTSALQLTNSATTPSTINMYVGATASTGNPLVTAGDNAIIGSAGALTLATVSATTCGIRIFAADMTVRGTLNIRDACNFVNNLPESTIATTTSGNQFITKNIADALYPAVPTGGYARLTTVANTFTNANTFNAGANNTVFTGAAIIMRTLNNVAELPTAGATATPAFRVRDFNGDTKTIKFIPIATVGALNPITVVNDSVISADSVLTLTADGATEVGIRIADTGAIDVKGSNFTIAPTGNSLFTGSAVLMRTTNNLAENPSAGATATPAFRVRNFNDDTNAIKFVPLATVDALNPITVANDSVISGGSVLTLTAEHPTNEVGIRIADTGSITIKTAVAAGTINVEGGAITIAPTGNTFFTGAAVLMRTLNNLAENTVLGATATPAFRVREFNSDSKTIKFIPNATVGALNPAVLVNNSVISADSVLTLTADGAITSGIRIADTGVVTVVGTTNTLSSTTTSITGTTLSVSASTSSTFNSFVTFNTQVPLINVDATGASTKEAVNWAVVTSRLATTVSNLLGGINTWTQSNTFNTSISQLLPFIYNFAAAQAYANTGMVGYSLTSTTRLVATVGTTSTNVASINLPAAYGMWLIEFECDFNTTTDAFYQMGLTTTSGGNPLTHSDTEAYARSASSAMTMQSRLLFKNSVLSQTVYGVIRGTPASTSINTVSIRFTRLG